MMEHSTTTVGRGEAAVATRPRVIVGVDGTAANWSAVLWAAAEARSSGRPLLLVACTSSTTPALGARTDDLERGASERLTADLLESVRSHIVHQAGEVSTHVAIEDAAHALVWLAGEQDRLVVGKRRGHPWSNAVLGSTAVAVAGRSTGPVVVVPEAWSVDDHVEQRIVVGIDGPRDGGVLDAAFDRAEGLGVGLVVVHALGASLPQTVVASDVHQSSADTRVELDDLLAPRAQSHPHVNVTVQSHPLTPTVSLLGAATDAQLLIVGRHAATHPHGPGLGSTTRKLLHHASCPVMVTPREAGSGLEAESLVFDEGDVPEF
jgi:nucleotide-binding universal stress UspA family protein